MKKILTNTFLVTLSFFVGNVFSYLLHIFLGRGLSVSEYAEFSVLLSLFNIFSVPATALSTTLTKQSSEFNAAGKKEEYTSLFSMVIKYEIVFGLIFVILTLFFNKFILSYLNLNNFYSLLFFSIYVALTLFTVAPVSYLQGFSLFKEFSFLNLINALLRLLLPIIFVLLGFKVSGAYIGLSASSLFVIFFSFFLLKKFFVSFKALSLKPYMKQFGKLFLASVLSSLGLVLLSNSDVVLVKHYFSSELSGLYASVVVVGKVFLFGAGTISVVMFTQVTDIYTKKGDVKKVFMSFLSIIILVSLLLLPVFFLFPSVLIRTLFGLRFIEASTLLPLFTIFVLFFVLDQFFVMFFLAVNKKRVSLLVLGTALFQYVLITVFHSSLKAVIVANIVSSLALFVIMLLYFVNYVSFSNSSGLQKRENN